MSATLGLGTYRCAQPATAARIAVAHGVGWFDTAPNYSHGSAQRALAPVLAEHPRVRVCTKVGFAASGGHSLTPAYVREQVRRNHHQIGRQRLDLVLVHNPEHGGADRDTVAKRLSAAFSVLERAADANLITGYGVATWSGFTAGVFTVADLVELAERAASGQSRLAAIQLPVSLVHLAPLADALAGHGPLIEADQADLAVFASAALHGGELPGMLTSDLVELVRPGASPAQACLAVVASTPGVDTVLLSASSQAHWAQAADAIGWPPLSDATLRRIARVLG